MKDRNEWPKMKTETRSQEIPEVKLPSKSSRKPSLETRSHVSHQRKVSPENKANEWRLDPARFSNWTRLVHVHARVSRAVHNMQHRAVDKVTSIELQPHEIA